jgi:hypothetical protein
MIENVIKVTRAIRQPYSSVILISVQGLGKAAISCLSIHICRFDRAEMTQAAEFDEEKWRQSLARMIASASVGNQANVLTLQENQISEDVILVDLNCILKNGELPELLAREELAYHTAGVKSSLTAAVAESLSDG